MQTLRLRVNDKIYDKLIGLLAKFRKDDIEVITEDEKFLSDQKYLQNELNEINKGEAHFITLEDLDNNLESLISKKKVI